MRARRKRKALEKCLAVVVVGGGGGAVSSYSRRRLNSMTVNNVTFHQLTNFTFFTAFFRRPFLRNLASNPFKCNCHLAWFSDWLRKRGLSGSAPHCAAPAKVRDVAIKDLPHHEFKCLSDADEGCLGEGYCPPSCVCTGTVVRCSRNKLTEIPRGIPAETSELYLESNEISMIHHDRISHLKSLTRL